ncbi:MAG: hypothetical protein R2751_16535 [Bacteroidales bacterium]
MKNHSRTSLRRILRTLIPFFVLTSGCVACNEILPLASESDDPELPEMQSQVVTQRFTIGPEGGELFLFGDRLYLRFHAGTVTQPTTFTAAVFPIHHLDLNGMNTYGHGFSLESDEAIRVLPNVIVRIHYDQNPELWKKSAPEPGSEEGFHIFHVTPNVYAYQRITPLCDCRVNCDCQTIQGTADACGMYVVGEN